CIRPSRLRRAQARRLSRSGRAGGIQIFARGRLLLLNDKVVAPVLRPAGFVVLVAQRQLFAIADRRHAAGVDAQRLEVILGGLRALGAERNIVFLGAALVAVPFDLHVGLRMVRKPGRVRFQDRTVLLLDVVGVVAEMDVAKRSLRAVAERALLR